MCKKVEDKREKVIRKSLEKKSQSDQWLKRKMSIMIDTWHLKG